MPGQSQEVLLLVARLNDKIIIRPKEDLFVEFTRAEAVPVVKSLTKLYDDKLGVSKAEISKIMASMREMDNLISSYQNLV